MIEPKTAPKDSINSLLNKFIDADDAINFLKSLWFYASLDAKCFAIVAINEDVKFWHFCLDELQNYENLFNVLRKFLTQPANKNIYFQVLPLSQKPAQGRGSEKDVKVGKWLWIDLDYKETSNEAEFEGCRELEDHALECYYREGNKWIHVRRPPLKQVLDDVKNKLDLEPSFVVDSGAGYHLYFKLMYETDASKLKNLESWLVEKIGGDPQAKDLARILRLPGSINMRVGRLVQVIYSGSYEIDPEALLKKIEIEKKKPSYFISNRKSSELRELNDTQLLQIKDLLMDAYTPGYRQSLCLYLSGYLAKARVSPISAVKIIKMLYESTADTDPLKTRLSAVVYSYKKAGINIDTYADQIESLTGVMPYGIEREIQEDEIKGISGIQEILEKVHNDENKAITILYELSKILGSQSPFNDSIIYPIDDDRQLYVVVNLHEKFIARAKMEKNGLKIKERVISAVPTKFIKYVDPLGGSPKYEITFEGKTLIAPRTVGPAYMDDICSWLASEGSLVYHRRLLNDIMNAVAAAYVETGRAEIRMEPENPGFYLIENKISAIKYTLENIDTDKLRKALLFLNELADVWFKHVQDKFSDVIKWGAVAPFFYVLKQIGKWQRWLFLYGDSATGKTTLGRIVLKMWGLDSKHEKTGANIDTIARLGGILGSSTFPVLINEPGNALSREDIIESIKNAIDNKIVRGRFVSGNYVEVLALAPVIFTSNRVLLNDDALLRRIKVLHFSFSEKIPPEKQKEFKEKVEQNFGILSEIGKCISKVVLESQDPKMLDGKTLLGKCYELAKLEKPAWLDLDYTEDTNLEESIIEEFAERLKKYITDSFARYSGKTPGKTSIEDKIWILVSGKMLAGIRLQNEEIIYMIDESNMDQKRDVSIVLTASLLKEIGLDGKVSLKSLAEILGFEYKTVRVSDRGVVKGAVTTIGTLAKMIE
ncbi:MAG: hypothetical protein QW550_05610 [Saccharolobus sp.]